MRAISLWQPWASLWCSGVKIHETRHWPTAHRGWLLVHAAKRRIDDHSGSRLDDLCASEFGNHWGMEIPRGAIVGAVDVVDCRRTLEIEFDHDDVDQANDYECGNFEAGRYGWRADGFLMFADPIPYRGAQGFFDVPDELVREAMAGARGVGAEIAKASPTQGALFK